MISTLKAFANLLFLAATSGKRLEHQERSCSNLNRSEIFIEFGIQGGKFIYRAVEDAVVVSKQLTQEEGSKWYIHNYSLQRRIMQKESHSVFATCKVCGYLGGLQDTLCVVGQIQRFKMLKSAEKATFS